MAKNWKCNEAVRAIQAGDKAAIQDIGRRFPLFANLAAQVNEAGAAILDCVPEYCTARKIESVLKGDVPEVEEDEVEEVEEKAPAKKAPAKKSAKKAPAKKEVEEEEDDEDDLESKSAKELYEMCKEKGLKVKAKQDKEVYIEALTKAEEPAEEEDWEEEEEEKPAPKKAAKKPAKKAKEEDDEDDDWDI